MPKDLYNLDILDGSPPCSSFSVAGNREKDWGKKKKFREGQSKQVLDTLFFDFIDLAKKLQPKVVVAENVKGLLLGNAKEYVIKIYKEFDAAGYYCQHFLLDAKKMGVPQRRERVFFICLRKDLAEKFMYNIDMFTQIPEIQMIFNEPIITFKEIYDGKGKKISEYALNAWNHRKKTDTKLSQSKKHAGMKETDFNNMYVFKDKVMPTITGKAENAMTLFDEPIKPSITEITLAGSFPLDYKCNNIGYVVGMSVPPVMVANVANEIYKQWLSKLF